MSALLYETGQWAPNLSSVGWPLLDQIRAAARAGFDGIAFDRSTVDAHVAAGGTLGEIADALDELRLEVRTITGVAIADRERTMRSVGAILDFVRAVRPHVAQAMFFVPAADARAGLAAAAAVLAGHGVRLAVEFMPMSPVADLTAARRALAGVDNTGLCIDSWHACRSATTWAEIEALGASEIASVQFDDALPLVSADLMDETIRRRALPGEGELDLTRFRDAIVATGYDGSVGVEILSDALRALPLDEFARRAHDTSAPFWRPVSHERPCA